MSQHLQRRAFLAMTSMLAASAAAAWSRPTRQQAEFGPSISLVEMFPERFGDWFVDPTIVPVQPSPELQKVIAETYDQTLARTYRSAEEGYRIMLSVAYGGRQTEGMNTHQPEICYPAQGMSIRKSGWRSRINVADRTLPINRLVAGHGARNEPISYWLVVGRNITDFGLQHKLATLKYGLTGRIPDGMLVRVSSIDENEARSFAMQDRFVREMLANLSPVHRQHLLGAMGG
jgi:EpsI family protein